MLEVMFAFGLVVFICASVLPILTIVYQERMTLEEEADVLYTLEEMAQLYMIYGNESLFNDSRVSVKKEEVRDNVMRFCSSWIGANGREYEHCLLAAR